MKITRLLCGAVLGSALSGPAIAGERMVMPFACQVVGGQISLVPSAPKAYQIYGPRQQKRLTTCSPHDPRNCHTWSVHRFDLDCGGVRTSWQTVVAALSPILAEAVGPPGGAAYPPPPVARAYRPNLGPGIAFPRGFAPNPMRVARFERVDLAPVNVPLPLKKPVPAAPTQVAEAEPSLEPTVGQPSPRDETEATAETASAKAKTTELAQHQALQVEVDSGSREITSSLPKPDARSGSLWRDAGLVFTVMLAALLALSAVLVMWRRKLVALPIWIAPQLRRFAALPAYGRMPVAEPESATAHEQREEMEAPAVRLRLWDKDWLPTTKNEALNVLGVDPAAGKDTIKSTVTRLRRALHPDHAFDEEDRNLRERRLKQINVAWEIVSGKRRAPWLSASPRSS